MNKWKAVGQCLLVVGLCVGAFSIAAYFGAGAPETQKGATAPGAGVTSAPRDGANQSANKGYVLPPHVECDTFTQSDLVECVHGPSGQRYSPITSEYIVTSSGPTWAIRVDCQNELVLCDDEGA